MSKDIDVIHAFNLEIEEDELNTLKNTHSFISDKLILDVVNGVNVVARDLNNVSKIRESKLSRFFDSISGKSSKRQNLINENLIEGITACSSWLSDHDRHISRIDNRICEVVNELDRTQDEILKFYEQHKNLKFNVSTLKDSFVTFKESSILRMKNIENRIEDIDIRDSAYNLVNREITALRADKFKDYSIPIQIYSFLDNIKNGYAGVYYNREQDLTERNEFKKYIENKLKIFITDSFDKEYLTSFISFDSLINETDKLENIKKNVLSFISTQQYNEIISLNKSPVVSDLISIVSSYSSNESKSEIYKQSNISNFISYDEFIEVATVEHLLT